MDSCSKPAFTGNQFGDCPLSITSSWNLLLRKRLISVRASLEIPTSLSL